MRAGLAPGTGPQPGGVRLPPMLARLRGGAADRPRPRDRDAARGDRAARRAAGRCWSWASRGSARRATPPPRPPRRTPRARWWCWRAARPRRSIAFEPWVRAIGELALRGRRCLAAARSRRRRGRSSRRSCRSSSEHARLRRAGADAGEMVAAEGARYRLLRGIGAALAAPPGTRPCTWCSTTPTGATRPPRRRWGTCSTAPRPPSWCWW